MEPTSTPPWRVLDAPTAAPGAAAVSGPGAGSGPAVGPASDALLLRIVLAIGGVLACVVVAVVLAVGGGSPSVVVDGPNDLAVTGSGGLGSGDPVVGGAPGSSTGELVVEIVGAVPAPGVYRLPVGARIGDLVVAAGGYSPRVDTVRAARELRLATPLADGDQVRVPSRDDPVEVAAVASPAAGGGGAPGSATGTNLVDLNHASQSELEALPGIGPVTAGKIIAAREEAPFAAVDELRSRGILGEKTFEQLRDLVTVS